MPKINPSRLLDDLKTLKSFGSQGTGVVRPSFSPIDMAARRWLCERTLEAGLDARIDGVGNVIGRSRNPGPALLLGSHSDTQPRGGWLDGAMGVIYALEVARACAKDAATNKIAVDTVAWVDEEGTYSGCFGSRSFCGLIAPEEIAAAHNDAGQSLTDALKAAGLNGVAARPEPGRYRGYLEAHIEQGANLENDGMQIGVVSAIVGSRNFTVRFSGQQNHAGTTPMPRRKDAGRALIDYAYQLNQALEQISGPRTVWTIGRVVFDPGTASIIPGKAEMNLQFRDPEESILDAFEAKAREWVDRMNKTGPVAVSIEPVGKPVAPKAMAAELQQHLAAAAETHAPGKWQHMPSAALHDAMFLAEIMPAAMLFVPSINGISHDFAENTSDEDIVRGCQVLATAVASILR